MIRQSVSRKVAPFVLLIALAMGMCFLTVPASAAGLGTGSLDVLSLGSDDSEPSAANATTVASGTWGTAPWTLDSTGTLTVQPGEVSGSLYDDLSGATIKKIKKIAFRAKGGSKVVCSGYPGRLFSGLRSVASIDLSGLDTSKVTNASYMFEGCSALKSLDLSPLDTSRVGDMSSMFYGCSALKSLDLSSFDTSKVKYMDCMFEGCSSLETLDLSSFDTWQVTGMHYMFTGCSSLKSLDLSSFDTWRVTGMSSMFTGCSSLVSLDLSSFDTSKVASMGYMFSGCTKLSTLNLGSKCRLDYYADLPDPPNNDTYTGKWEGPAGAKTSAQLCLGSGIAAMAGTWTWQKHSGATGANWYRLWGEKALDTMEAVTREFGSSSEFAVVTNNIAYRDALAASALAGSLNAPIFMTDKDTVSRQTWRELVRLKVRTVYIVGSDEGSDPAGYTISRNVERQLKTIGGVTKVVRVGNKSVSGRSVGAAKAMPAKSKTVIIAIQTSYRDALSISTYAYASKSPILYVERDKALGDHVVKYIKDGGFTRAIIVGGPNPIPASVDDQLVAAGIARSSITRLAGQTAYDTSRIIAEWSTGGLANGTGGGKKSNFYYHSYVKFQPDVRMGWDRMGAAQARGWRDGISSTALCGKNRAVVLLVDHTDTSNVALIGRNKTKISEGYVFGGEGAFKKWVFDDIVKATRL